MEDGGELHQRRACWSIFAAALTPLPRIVAGAAGVFRERVSLWTSLPASTLRISVFFLVAAGVFLRAPRRAASGKNGSSWRPSSDSCSWRQGFWQSKTLLHKEAG